MRISVIGCGYLGAVHAVAMVRLGHRVVGIDIDADRISRLAHGSTPFYEPGLDELLQEGLASGRLRFTTDVGEASNSDVHFIAVGTPQSESSNAAEMSFVDAALEALIPHLSPEDLVVGKSTVPVGTAERLSSHLTENAPGAALAWNPEFLREGFAVQDTLRPDRIVYGLPKGPSAERAERMLDEVYAEALAAGTPKIVTDFATSELVKVAANAFLATKISFINAMAEISEIVGADVTSLADAIGHDARIGRRFLNAGIGFGGGCLPKDIRAFAARAEELGAAHSVAFLYEVDAINLRRRARVVEMVAEELQGELAGRRVTVLGTTFKPDSDDVRDSPALDVSAALHELGVDVVSTDPQGVENARRRHPELRYEPQTEQALSGAEVVVLATEWSEYRELDPVRVREATGISSQPVMIDARNCLVAEHWRSAGWRYRGLGRE